ncbi:MAG: hypothetical protein K6F35_08010 [Lachnospiraceae bacterium]|nr:hypothetical protein [Lachnospiraceae bacterium]
MAVIDRNDLKRISKILSAFIEDGGNYECRMYDRSILGSLDMLGEALGNDGQVITDGIDAEIAFAPYPADRDYYDCVEDWADDFI